MTWKRLCWAASMALGLIALCCACSVTESEYDADGSADGQHLPYVGVVLKSTDNPYFSLIKAGAEYEADARGVQVMVVSPETEENVQEQTELLETMAGMSVDVIAVSPTSETEEAEVLTQIEESGKILLTVDTPSDVGSCYIGSDQYLSAYHQGAYAAGLAETGGAVILRGAEGDKAHNLRTYGLEDGLTDSGSYVLSAVDCGTDEDEAETAMKELLEEYGEELTIVCTTSDSMALGAQRAVADAGRGDVHIVSYDGLMDVVELVQDGQIDAAFAQDPYEMGRLCIEYACRLYDGESVDASVHTDVTLITAENAAEHLELLRQQLNVWNAQ